VTAARALLPAAWLLLCTCTFAAKLHIDVQDERGTPVWTRLEVRNRAGQEFQSPGSFHENMQKARSGKPFYLGSFIVHGVASLDVPPGLYTVIAEHGLECERIERELSVTDAGLARLALHIRPCIRLQFGSYELDPSAHELRKHGLKVRLSPQAFRVLGCLLERRGELVTRDQLFHELWPEDTHVEYEANLNAIVRVLREALGDSARNPRFIETEPKAGYRFIAPVSAIVQPSPGLEPAVLQPIRRTTWVLRVALSLVIVCVAGWVLWRVLRADSSGLTQIKLTQISHFLGVAGHPSFSPDGTHLAFHWNGTQRGDYDVYVMRIVSDELRRVTTDPADDMDPAWSPDGRDIAFVRAASNTESLLILAPAMGGAERAVARLPRVRAFAWSPDGQWIAYSLAAPDNPSNAAENQGIRAISLATGQTVAVTPSRNGDTDSFPSFSRDGRTLAFVRRAELWSVAIDRNLKTQSTPKQTTLGSVGPLNPL